MKQEREALAQIEETISYFRKNGEIAFSAPWEGRIFAMAVLLHEKGLFPWKTFNQQFVQEINQFEREHPERDVAHEYYRLWLTALEKVLLGGGWVAQEQLKQRTEEFATGARHHVC